MWPIIVSPGGVALNLEAETTERLVDLLQVEPGERSVLSVIYDASDEARLRYGSLLFGPAEMAAASWSAWHRRHVETAAAPPGRAELSVEGAVALLEGSLHGEIPAIGPLPRLRAELEPPATQIRVFPHQATPAGQLAFAVGRPVSGFLFPSDVEGRDLAPSFANGWTIDGVCSYTHRISGTSASRLEQAG
jgi:hypothetical protein